MRRARAAGEARAAWAPRLARKHGNLHLLHGAGGTGKTALLQVLEDVMLRGGFGRIVFLAFMGVAAALLPHSRRERTAERAAYSEALRRRLCAWQQAAVAASRLDGEMPVTAAEACVEAMLK